MKNLIEFSKKIPRHAESRWVPYALGLSAFADYFIFIIPLDAIVVATILAARKKWFTISLWTTIGSTLGAGIFAEMIRIFGQSGLDRFAPHLLEGKFAQDMSHWLNHYGFWALIGVAAMPLAQHPVVAIAALAKVPLFTIITTLFIGRFFKYAVYTWLSTHAQKGLGRFFTK